MKAHITITAKSGGCVKTQTITVMARHVEQFVTFAKEQEISVEREVRA